MCKPTYYAYVGKYLLYRLALFNFQNAGQPIRGSRVIDLDDHIVFFTVHNYKKAYQFNT